MFFLPQGVQPKHVSLPINHPVLSSAAFRTPPPQKKKVKLVERLVKGIMVLQAINNKPVMVKVLLREGEDSQNNLKETARENIRAYRLNSYH